MLTCLSQYPLALNRQFRKVIAIYCRSFTIHTLSDVMLCHFGFKTAVLKLAEGVHNSLYVIQVTELASGISSVNLSTRLHFVYNVLRLKLEKFKIRFDLKKSFPGTMYYKLQKRLPLRTLRQKWFLIDFKWFNLGYKLTWQPDFKPEYYVLQMSSKHTKDNLIPL